MSVQCKALTVTEVLRQRRAPGGQSHRKGFLEIEFELRSLGGKVGHGVVRGAKMYIPA